MSSLLRLLMFCAISLCAFAQGNKPFPVVDKSVQKERDVDRRAILETELAAEQHALDGARAAMAKAPADDTRNDVHRHEENLKALQHELERLPNATPVRVGARKTGADAAVLAKRPTATPAQAPFWDVYRRGASHTDF